MEKSKSAHLNGWSVIQYGWLLESKIRLAGFVQYKNKRWSGNVGELVACDPLIKNSYSQLEEKH